MDAGADHHSAGPPRSQRRWRPSTQWTSIPADPDRAVPSHAVNNENVSGWRNAGSDTFVKKSFARPKTVLMAIILSGALVAVCWLLYIMQQHAPSVGHEKDAAAAAAAAHGRHRSHPSGLHRDSSRNSSSSSTSHRTPDEGERVLAKFPKGMPDYCQLQHLDAPRLLHMASNPAPSSKAF